MWYEIRDVGAIVVTRHVDDNRIAAFAFAIRKVGAGAYACDLGAVFAGNVCILGGLFDGECVVF